MSATTRGVRRECSTAFPVSTWDVSDHFLWNAHRLHLCSSDVIVLPHFGRIFKFLGDGFWQAVRFRSCHTTSRSNGPCSKITLNFLECLPHSGCAFPARFLYSSLGFPHKLQGFLMRVLEVLNRTCVLFRSPSPVRCPLRRLQCLQPSFSVIHGPRHPPPTSVQTSCLWDHSEVLRQVRPHSRRFPSIFDQPGCPRKPFECFSKWPREGE